VTVVTLTSIKTSPILTL